MKDLSPSLLAFEIKQIPTQLTKIAHFNLKYIHYDVMDGQFVKNYAFGPEWLQPIKSQDLFAIVHLMVLNIKKYLKIFFKYPAEAIIFHVEACNGIKQIEKFLALIKKNGYKCGVAFKPQTDCLLYEQIFNLCDYLLILGVEPGFGGQKYQEATTKKLFGLKQIEKKALVLLDGGVNLDVIKQTSGLVDQYISGSFFMQASFAQKKNIIDTIKNMP